MKGKPEFDQLRFNFSVFTFADPKIYGEKMRLLCIVRNPAVIRNSFLKSFIRKGFDLADYTFAGIQKFRFKFFGKKKGLSEILNRF
jgi:lipid II:glycine glycyltransferase (peptidoglycan interpeptide bridge formation enzyme)